MRSPGALRALAACTSESEAETAYNRVLYALGNNHAGSYYSVALGALPFLGEMLVGGSESARVATLDILIDLVGSFAPEPGFETVLRPQGETGDVQVLLRQGVAAFATRIQSLVLLDDRTTVTPGHSAAGPPIRVSQGARTRPVLARG